MSADPPECCFNLDGIGDSWFQCSICGKCERRFKNTGEPMSGYHDANVWLTERGYAVGYVLQDDPVGVLRAPAYVHPWWALTPDERNALDGRITWGGGDPRTADALVELTEAP